MMIPKSLTGTIHLPDARLNFHLSFSGKETKNQSDFDGLESMDRILNQASELSPELERLLIEFADYLKKRAEPAGQSSKE